MALNEMCIKWMRGALLFVMAVLLACPMQGCWVAKVRQSACEASPNFLCARIDCVGECPSSPMNTGTGSAQFVCPVADSAMLYAAPRDKLAPLGMFSFPSMGMAYRTARDEHDNAYILVGNVGHDNRLLGWVKAKHVVTFSDVVEYRRSSRGILCAFIKEDARVYPSPFRMRVLPWGQKQEAAGDELKPLKVDKPYLCFPYYEKDDYFLLGRTPNLWEDEQGKGTSILGWVHRSQMELWGSGIGLLPSARFSVHGTEASAAANGAGPDRLAPAKDISLSSALPIVGRQGGTAHVKLPPEIAAKSGNDGWVNVEQAKPADFAALMDRQTVYLLITVFNKMLEHIDDSHGRPGALASAGQSALENSYIVSKGAEYPMAQVLDGVPDELLQDEYFRRHPAELEAYCADSSDRCVEVMKRVRRSVALLESVSKEYEVVVTDQSVEPVLDETGNGYVRKPYWFHFNDGAQFAWVPLDYFP